MDKNKIDNSNRAYSVFDWDNTLREGYTLFSWVKYLCEHSILCGSIGSELDFLKDEYINGRISHDDFANIACVRYAAALKGISESIVSLAAVDYVRANDLSYVFGNCNTLFDILNSKEVDIVIISGAPLIVLEKYIDRFHIKGIYAFKEKICNGVFTGEVEYNYGFRKDLKVEELINRYGFPPTFAFGDSESDLPMLSAAKYPFCIGGKMSEYKNVIINDHKIPDGLLEEIRSLL